MRLRLALSIVLVEILLLLIVLPLLLAWLIYYRGGVHWLAIDQKKETFFNLHPLCMVLGFVIVLSQGILVYRVIPGPKIIAKIVHACLHLLTFVLVVLGFVVIWKVHEVGGKNQIYTLHGWVGSGALLLFGLQFLFGFTYFLGDGFGSLKEAILPVHRFLGCCILVLACIASVAGINMSLGYGMSQHDPKINGTNEGYDKRPPEATVGNLLGIAICVAVATVIFVATRPSFQRKQEKDSLYRSYSTL